MKRFLFIAGLGAVCMLMSCATMIPVGGLYTGAKFPMMVTSNSNASSKTGEAQCISILTLVAVGDCSVETAKKNGGITKVNNVDWDVKNILGIYGTYKVIVSGE
ncbi:MAG TPA: TRL-like family protein [Smithella sp.]|nr:TRL-like family protein [Smithella sp.]